MKQNGDVLNVVHFNQLIQNLLFDGDIDAAQHVYDVEMPAAGIAPNRRTRKTIARAPKLPSMG